MSTAAKRGTLVVRAPNWVGDLVMATPVISAAVAAARGESATWGEVRVVVRKHLAPLLADAPWFDAVETIPGSKQELSLYRELAPEAVMLLSNSFGAAWRAYRSGAPIRVGSALSARRWLLSHSFIPPTRAGRRVPVPTAHLHRDVAGLLGIHIDSLHPQLWVRPELEDEVRAELAAAGLGRDEGYVFCCPGAAFGAAKLWPPERFAAALDGLHARHGWRAVIGGGPGEEPLMAAVAQACEHPALDLSNVPRDLERLKAQVKHAELLLVGDSGPRWVAAAFDVPCVTVMGPNFPELTASSLELAQVVRVEGLACSPCLQRKCPLGHHRCMTELPVDAVLAAAETQLARQGVTP